MERFKSALGGARAKNLPCWHALRVSLEGDDPEIAIFEQAAGQFACAGSNDYSTRFGKDLKASGKIGGLADHGLLLGGASADQIAHDDETGCDPDAPLQGRAGAGGVLRHSADE